jgi:hypothetical protein
LRFHQHFTITASFSAMQSPGGMRSGVDLQQKHLEGCLYRRRSDQATFASRNGNDWSYHNHIVQGGFLRYIQRPLTTKEASSYRFVLVAGKAKGRLSELHLHPESEVTTGQLNESEAPAGNVFIINVSGSCADGAKERWQLALPSAQLQLDWVEALSQAKRNTQILQQNGEYDKLIYIGR